MSLSTEAAGVGWIPLLVLRTDGRLLPVTPGQQAPAESGDRTVALAPAALASRRG